MDINLNMIGVRKDKKSREGARLETVEAMVDAYK